MGLQVKRNAGFLPSRIFCHHLMATMFALFAAFQTFVLQILLPKLLPRFRRRFLLFILLPPPLIIIAHRVQSPGQVSHFRSNDPLLRSGGRGQVSKGHFGRLGPNAVLGLMGNRANRGADGREKGAAGEGTNHADKNANSKLPRLISNITENKRGSSMNLQPIRLNDHRLSSYFLAVYSKF